MPAPNERDLPRPEPGALHAVILAGGPGERFWPASTPAAPKPFVRLFGPTSLLQQTLARTAGLAAPEDTWIVGAQAHGRRLRAEAASWLPEDNVLLETARRDTAPAVAMALAAVSARDPHAVLMVTPSDHYVPDAEAFAATMRRALAAARRGRLTCIGVPPLRPETRYGYIVAGEGEVAPGVHPALRFVEKPQAQEAERLLSTGRAYWNAGLLVCRADALRAAFAAHAPDILAGAEALSGSRDPAAAYAALPAISLDYAVLQKADNVAVAPASFRWHDVGGWAELPLVEADEAGNFVRGSVRLVDTSGSVVYNTADQPLVVQGMEGVLVAQTAAHVTLVAPLQSDARRLLRELEAGGGIPSPRADEDPWTAALSAAPPSQVARHPWGEECVWAESAAQTAAAVRVRAGGRAFWRCPDGWTETDWVAAGRGTVRVAGQPAPASPGRIARAAAGDGIEVEAEAEVVLWRLRVPSADGPAAGQRL